jgi:hypothetical protein
MSYDSNWKNTSYFRPLQRACILSLSLTLVLFLSYTGAAQTLSAVETADTLEMPRRAFGLSSSEQLFVQNTFLLFSQDTLAYIAIHGANSTFQIVEGNTWKTISHRSLAKWIAENRAYDGKTIVLLSCSDTLSTQNLTNALALLDNAATPKRPTRKIISWNGEVALFANGFIQGDGFCRMYAPMLSGSSKPPIPILLTGSEIPVGSEKLPTAETPFLLMAGGRSLSDEGKRIKEVVSPAKLQSYLVKWRAFKVRMKSNYADNPLIIQTNLVPVQKKVNKQLQTVLVEEKTIAQLDLLLESWLYLKYNVDIGESSVSGNYDFLVNLHKVMNKGYYKLNDKIQISVPPNPLQYLNVQTALDTFVCVGRAKQFIIDSLSKLPDNSTAKTVIEFILKAGKKTNLVSFLGTTPLSNLDRNIKILSSLQNNNVATILAAFVKDTTKMPTLPATMPSNHGLTVGFLNYMKRSLAPLLAGNPTYVEDARRTITGKMNKIMGDTVSYQQLLNLTADKSFIEQNASRGAIFEHWGFKWFNKDTTKLGRTLFRKNPDNLYSDDEIDTKIIVDFYHKLNVPLTTKVVAVELKHSPDAPTEQLRDRQAILRNPLSIIDHFIYVFAEKPIMDVNYPTQVEKAPVVIKIRAILGQITEIYYFYNGILTKIP